MTRPTTIRLPKDLLDDIEQFIQESKLDRAAYLREILRKGFDADRQERIFQRYMRRELSQIEVCQTLELNPWQFVSQLKNRGLHLNVELEDLLDSSELSGKT
jgi:hypothetical protein